MSDRRATLRVRTAAPRAASSINQLSPQYLFLGSILSTDVKNLTPTQQATLASAGITLPANFNTSQTVAQALEPFPNYKSVS